MDSLTHSHPPVRVFFEGVQANPRKQYLYVLVMVAVYSFRVLNRGFPPVHEAIRTLNFCQAVKSLNVEDKDICGSFATSWILVQVFNIYICFCPE